MAESPDGATRDVVDTVLGFARTLRHAGVPASPDRVEAMLAALGSLDVLNPTDVYWAGRLTLCGSPDDLDPDLAARTLGAVLKYREDTDRVHALARGALFGG